MPVKSNTEEFTAEANLVHNNKYDYFLVDYKGTMKNVKIICPIHGEFIQRASHHLNGCGCPKCGGTYISNTEEWVEKVNLVHNNKYDYSLVDYKIAHSKVKIICPIHGEFIQRAYSHLKGHGCPMCYESKGELKTNKLLAKMGVSFERQKTYKDCRNANVLRFDFFIPSKNILIEYNGIQHYKYRKFFGEIEKFETLQLNDEIKKNYCIENNIKLITISYTEYNNIEIILKDYFEE